MEIIYDEEQIKKEFADELRSAATECLREEGLPEELIEVSLTFADEEEIREINRKYRATDKVTDVLSFPQYEREELLEVACGGAPAPEVVLLGDVVICPKQAGLQAEEFGHSEQRELTYLFVHSMFHLLGYDHMQEEERAVMRAKEEKIMSILGLAREV